MTIKVTSPAVFEYSSKLYEALYANSETREYEGVSVQIFEGGMTGMFKSLDISQGYYSPIQKVLKTLGCVTIMQRGGSGTPTIAVLHRPPDKSEWENLSDERLTPNTDVAILRSELDDVRNLLGGINIVAALSNIEQRLSELENALGNK